MSIWRGAGRSLIAIALAVGWACMADPAEDSSAATEAEPEPAATSADSTRWWKLGDGLVVDVLEKKIQLRLGAYAYFDYANISQSRAFDRYYGEAGSDGEVRTARISVNGHLYRHWDFKFEIAIEESELEVTDVFLVRSEIPYLGELRIGQAKEPFGLEQQQSSRHRVFMEPSLLTAVTPGRNVGFKFANAHLNDRLTWSAGMFYDTNSFEDVSDSDGIGFVGRLTGLPLLNHDKDVLLHLGLAYLHRGNAGEYDLSLRPESHLAPHYLNTGSISLSAQTSVALEAAYQRGPWLFQGEYIHSWLHDAEYEFQIDLDNVTLTPTAKKEIEFNAVYAQASYVLTGETREYFPGRGVFGTVIPDRNFGWGDSRGPGAWEIAARVSHIDLTDKFVRGGEETNFTLGLNWYLNPNWRVMFNYIHADVEVEPTLQLPNGTRSVKFDDDVDIFQMRLQFDFSPKGVSALSTQRLFHR